MKNEKKMTTEDYEQAKARIEEITPADKAAIVMVMRETGEIVMSVHGDPRSVNLLKNWIWRNCGGRDA